LPSVARRGLFFAFWFVTQTNLLINQKFSIEDEEYDLLNCISIGVLRLAVKYTHITPTGFTSSKNGQPISGTDSRPPSAAVGALGGSAI
jgi:hypothetical protein